MPFDFDAALQQLSVSLNPMQSQAVALGLLGSHNCLVSAPTASGKTMLAILKILKEAAESTSRQFRAIYVVPLQALAHEKFEEFSKLFQQFNLSVGISVGNFDDSVEKLFESNVLIVTSEKIDSILRHAPSHLQSISLAIVDEFHLINDDSRGATLEVVITKLLQSNCKILGLSATIGNAEEIALWLKALLVKSSYRPTKLVKGILAGDRLELNGNVERLDSKKPLESLVERILSEGKQALIFTSSRRGTESVSTSLRPVVAKFLSPLEKENLAAHSRLALKALSTPTIQCKNLANAFESGIAFHHAGLVAKQQNEIRKAFKDDRTLKVIVCTTTLAMGVDFPASYVVLKDLKRFNGNFSTFLPQAEVEQICGRAGRPRYDTEGRAIFVCGKNDHFEVQDRYMHGEVETIYSKLSSLPTLRIHCLAAIASSYCQTSAQLFSFFNSTLFAFQFKSNEEFLSLIEKAVLELKDLDFVREKNGKIFSTPIGKRVSDLYLDPKTASTFLDFVKNKKGFSELEALFLLTKSSELRPLVSVKASEENAFFEEAFSLDFDEVELAEKMKTAKLLQYWIEEKTEDEVLEKFDMPPGILHGKIKIAEWLLYALQEMSFISNATTAYENFKALRRRVKHGIKAELLSLCRIKGIGRVRARKLFDAGIKTADELKEVEKARIKEILHAQKEPVQLKL